MTCIYKCTNMKTALLEGEGKASVYCYGVECIVVCVCVCVLEERGRCGVVAPWSRRAQGDNFDKEAGQGAALR